VKQRDAEKLGKATEALLKRLRACQATLKAREKTVLTAIDSIFECNDEISKEFDKWNELSNELDEDEEIAPVMDDPKLDLDALILDAAFEAVHGALEEAIESFEDILGNANDYEEPEEEEDLVEVDEDDEDEEGERGEHFGCHANHAKGCHAESPGCDTIDEAEKEALKAGWKFDPDGWPYCPKHRDQA